MADDEQRARELLNEIRRSPTLDHVDELRELLHSEEPMARRCALDAFAMMGRFEPRLLFEETERAVELLDDEHREVRTGASDYLATVGERDGERVVDAVPKLVERLDDDFELVRTNAVDALHRAAQGDPESVAPYVDELFPFLDASLHAVRVHAAVAIANVSMVDAEAVVPAVPRLFKRFETGQGSDPSALARMGSPDDRSQNRGMSDRQRKHQNEMQEQNRDLRQAAGHALYEVALVEPDAVIGYAGAFAELLSDPDPQVKGVAADVFAALAEHDPEVVADHADALATALEVDAGFVNGPAARALLVATRSEEARIRDALAGSVGVISDLLDHPEPRGRAAAAGLLAVVGVEEPALRERTVSRLHELQESDEEYLQAAVDDALDTLA